MFCEIARWLPYSIMVILLFMGVLSLSYAVFHTTENIITPTPPTIATIQDYGLVSVSAPISDTPSVTPNIIVPLRLTVTQVNSGYITYSTTSDTAKFNVSGQNFTPITMIEYTPNFSTVDFVKITGVSSASLFISSSTDPKPFYFGVAYNDGISTAVVIAEMLSSCVGNFITLSIPFTASFTNTQTSVIIFTFVRIDAAPPINFSITALSTSVTEV